MTDVPPPPPAAPGPPTPPPAVPAPTAVYPPAPPAAPAKPLGKGLPIAAGVLAGVAFLTAVVPGPSGATWVFAIPAIVLAIIALVRKAPLRGVSIAAIIVAPLAWLIAIIVTVAGIASGVSSLPDVDDPGTSIETTEASPAPSAAEEPAATITGGDHVVGADFPAGLYRAEVAPSIIALCTISQQQGSDYVDLRNASEGSVIFNVQDLPGSVVSFSGCDKIALAADVIRAGTTEVTNGDWLVGSEIAAGQYKGTVDTASLLVLGTIVQYSGSDVVDLTNGTEGDVIFTVQDIPGSVVSFSGLVGIQKIG